MKVEISTPGFPNLIKTLEELQAILRKGVEDNAVDLVILRLETTGEASITHGGRTVTMKKIEG